MDGLSLFAVVSCFPLVNGSSAGLSRLFVSKRTEFKMNAAGTQANVYVIDLFFGKICITVIGVISDILGHATGSRSVGLAPFRVPRKTGPSVSAIQGN